MKQLHGNFDQWYEKMNDIVDSPNYWDKQKSNEYTSRNVKCPFLINNSCSIYEARPVVCRTYFSYGNPKNCESEMYPKGTINFDNIKQNIYNAPIANKIRMASKGNLDKEGTMFQSAFNIMLLPLWFIKE